MHAFSSGILKHRGKKMGGKHDVWICFVSSELSVHAFEKFGIKIWVLSPDVLAIFAIYFNKLLMYFYLLLPVPMSEMD